MSRSKQDIQLLDERIERIRKKNEEIKKRHLEVEADKQTAAKFNALVQLTSPSDDWHVRERSIPDIEDRKSEQSKPKQNTNSIRTPPHTKSGRCYNFAEGDGPPPDPAYRFLADAERDSQSGYTRHQQQRGGKNFNRNRGTSHRVPAGGAVSHPDYSAWRAERNQIDSERINRQKTAEGHWRREWDNEKIVQEEEVSQNTARGSRGSGFRNAYRDDSQDSSRSNSRSDKLLPRSQKSSERGHRGRGITRGNIRNRQTLPSQSPSSTGANVSANEEVVDNLVVHGKSERSVINDGESIKISVANKHSPAPVRRVKVNGPIVGGTGRVGPRHKIRISYSSQSEDETPRSSLLHQQSTSKTENATSSFTKPPLPPHSNSKTDNTRPRRQRIRHLSNEKTLITKRESDQEQNVKLSAQDNKKECESGGDDSWEDVTTTSGNESACEDISLVETCEESNENQDKESEVTTISDTPTTEDIDTVKCDNDDNVLEKNEVDGILDK